MAQSSALAPRVPPRAAYEQMKELSVSRSAAEHGAPSAEDIEHAVAEAVLRSSLPVRSDVVEKLVFNAGHPAHQPLRGRLLQRAVGPESAMETILRNAFSKNHLHIVNALELATYFAADSYTLSDFGKNILDKNTRIMRKYSSIKYLIEGHVEQTGSPEYVFALGEMRAKIVRDHMVSLGVSAARLTVCSYADSAVSGGVSDEIVQTGKKPSTFREAVVPSLGATEYQHVPLE